MWAMTSGILKATSIEQAGNVMTHGSSGLRFVQISDSHIGFDKPANTDVIGTLREAVAKIKAAAEPPAFVLHTGDLTHLSKPSEFDTLQQVLAELSMPVFYVPGEHDILEDDGKSTDVPLDAGGPQAVPVEHEVRVDNFAFTPAEMTVPAGTTISWTNHDDVPHRIVAVDQAFKSPVLDTDGRFSHTFEAHGSHEYFCSLHPKMTGTIAVV
jgi:plastocyanin